MPLTPQASRLLILSDAYLFLANEHTQAPGTPKCRTFDPFRQALIDTLSKTMQVLVVKTNDIYQDNSILPHSLKAEERMLEAIREFKPDWIVALNCAGLSPNVRRACQKPGENDIPALCWYLDSYKRISPDLQQFTEHDQLFLTGEGVYQSHFIEQFGVRSEQVHTLPFCTDPSIFCPPADFSGAPAISRNLDVSFVGTCFRSHQLNQWLALVVKSSSSNLAIFLRHYEVHKADYQYDLVKNMTQDGFDWSFLTQEQQATYEERLLPILDDQLSTEVRLEMLSAMAEFNLAIYGEPDDGWLNAIGLVDSRLFRAYQFQPIATPQALAALYHRSKIALNVPHHQASTHSLPIRVFDIMASGALLLTPASTVGALTSIGYEVGIHFVAGDSAAHMTQQAAYYLQNEDARYAITQAAQKKVLQQHTLQAVTERLLASANIQQKLTADSKDVLPGLNIYELPAELMPIFGKPVKIPRKYTSNIIRLLYTKLSRRLRLVIAVERLISASVA